MRLEGRGTMGQNCKFKLHIAISSVMLGAVIKREITGFYNG